MFESKTRKVYLQHAINWYQEVSIHKSLKCVLDKTRADSNLNA